MQDEINKPVSNAPTGLTQFLKPLMPYIEPDNVIEVCINRPCELFAETYDGWSRHELPVLTNEYLEALSRTVATFSDQALNRSKPILSGALPNGERIQIVMPPAVLKGYFSITIRKPSQRTFTLEDYKESGMFDDTKIDAGSLSSVDKELIELYNAKDWMNFLPKAVINKKNILVSGSTGSGKTTFSKALVPLIPSEERILTIEDTPELDITQPNHVRMIYSKGGQGAGNFGARELLESALRMRPDRIFLQELRDATAFYYLRNVNTGHSGSITTIHADSAMLAFEQLSLLVKESEAGRDLDRREIKEMLFQMIDVVVQVRRDAGQYRVTEVFFDPTRKSEAVNNA